jgi:D-alanyl-lipoteichoic acid acyltransferase DltB (MBOAT superfamily)
MLFNSVEFLVFFTLIVSVYFALPHRWRWPLLLAGSYYFYMCWKPAYIILIITSTLIDYFCALGMGRTSNTGRRKLLLLLSLCTNLGLLFTFKYLNFFAYSFKYVLGLGEQTKPFLNVLLPVGISFYTFQTLSYTIDVFRGIRPPEKRLGIFALYVSFFPQLVAGPIERSTRLLPQFDNVIKFDYERVVDGIRLMLWGFFKKVVIADTLGKFVDPVYNSPADYAGPSYFIATVFFAYQIYCDFSGYTDIARGSAQVLGIELMENFNRPYYSKSIREFWRRWHISLSTWFRDYLYIPIGGSRVTLPRHCFNLLIVFLLCGLWHGANWTFIIWGLLHGTYLVIGLLTRNARARFTGRIGLDNAPFLKKLIQVAITFGLTCFGWIFFRANSLTDAWFIVTHLFSGWQLLTTQSAAQLVFIVGKPSLFILCILLLIVLESVHLLERRVDWRTVLKLKPVWFRWAVYYSLVLSIMFLGNLNAEPFIYFQF